MQTISLDQYLKVTAGAYGHAKDHIPSLKGELPDYISDKIRQNIMTPSKVMPWTRIMSQLVEVYRICLAVSDSSQASHGNTYMEFINNVSINDFLAVKDYFAQGKDIKLGKGVVKMTLHNFDSMGGYNKKTDEASLMRQLLPYKTIYKLAKDTGHEEVCSLIDNNGVSRYLSAKEGIAQFIINFMELFDGEFIELIMDSVHNTNTSDKVNENYYWVELLQAIYVIYRQSVVSN